MTIQETLLKFLDSKLKVDLLESYEKTNRKASGNWGDKLNSFVETTDKGYRFGMKGEYYTYWMQNGRNQNKDQSPEGLLRFARWAGSNFIKKWLDDKGLTANPFAVAYSIAKKGYEPKPLLDFINADYFAQIAKEIGNVTINEFTSDFIKMFKKQSQ